MLIRKLNDCPEILAGDGTRLRELLHPDRGYPFGGRYSIAHAVIAAGEKSRRHRLKTSEVYYIISGGGIMHINATEAEVQAGDCFEIPAIHDQWLENTGTEPLTFLCVVDPAWHPHDEIILK